MPFKEKNTFTHSIFHGKIDYTGNSGKKDCINGLEECNLKLDPKECHLYHCTSFSHQFRGENTSCNHICSLCQKELGNHTFIVSEVVRNKFNLDEFFFHSYCSSIIEYSNSNEYSSIDIIKDIFPDRLPSKNFSISNALFLIFPVRIKGRTKQGALFRVPNNSKGKKTYQVSLGKFFSNKTPIID